MSVTYILMHWSYKTACRFRSPLIKWLYFAVELLSMEMHCNKDSMDYANRLSTNSWCCTTISNSYLEHSPFSFQFDKMLRSRIVFAEPVQWFHPDCRQGGEQNR